jgi:hypothetical protein
MIFDQWTKLDEVQEIILESLKVWKTYKKRNATWNTAGVTRGRKRAQVTSSVHSQLFGLEDVVFNDFIKDDFIPEGDGQVVSGSVSLPDPVVFETEEQMLQREQHECDVLDALDEYKSEAGMSVEDVSVIVNIKTLKG